MDILKFAKLNGVTITDMGPNWKGGRYGYSTRLAPNCIFCGFKSHGAAAYNWLNSLGFSEEGTKIFEQALAQMESRE